ncbi:DNA polymerase-3 subunit epsilon [Hydrogenispora ethanolica]|uniref:DNA polymerase-3 subunit epsilon n=1 Tax=Hydrogenispora ethanolica TaxID=1082276 RepID=A0A4R1R1L5_HYDET|nr:exonuclease domain-containing protein [Hydrogenispora ethanolica]TCL59230.1 DNA polymerase-3 subunit epsilon [Hydrogenispora ethanolica]
MELAELQEASPEWGVAAFLDVETTGLNPWRDEVIELSIYLFAFDRASGRIQGILGHYTGLREPACAISPGAARVHGITKDSINGRSLDDAMVEALVARAEFLIAHNAGFDYSFVRKLFPSVERKVWYCSMNGINWRKKGFPSKGLQNLLRAHRIGAGTAHRAGDDVRSCLMLLSQMNGQGVTYLLELLQGRKFKAGPSAHSPQSAGGQTS